MKINLVSLFPDFFASPLASGLLGKAVADGLLSVNMINIRDFATGNYRQCDDYPYGGGAGMVLMAGPLSRAIESIGPTGPVLMTSAGGELFTQAMARELSGMEELTIICGHYEGIDQRIADRYVDREVSIGNYVLSGGEFAALVIIDALARLIPGFMANRESLQEETFEMDLLEYPQYTRPAQFDGMAVPEVLLQGNHKEIARWRLEQSIEKTKRVRPDLYKKFLMKKMRGA